MQQVSVVIICKNEADIISKTIASLRGLTDDIVVYDNGSTDETVLIAREAGARVFIGDWEGFGKTKMRANSMAKYEWILSLDADEMIDETLKASLLAMKFEENTAYRLQFKNFLGNKQIRYGEWGADSHIRLFNRQQVHWNEEAVHESLVIPSYIKIKKIQRGHILHRTMKDLNDYAKKMVHYATLSAQKYYSQGKKASWFKRTISPCFNFINYYFFRLGFLDGHEGYVCAKMTSHYTFLKYAMLRELWKTNAAAK